MRFRPEEATTTRVWGKGEIVIVYKKAKRKKGKPRLPGPVVGGRADPFPTTEKKAPDDDVPTQAEKKGGGRGCEEKEEGLLLYP